MPNNTQGWGAFLPRYNIPETFGTAIAYEAQLHWFLENWNEVADYANSLEQPTVTVGKTEFPDTSNALLPSIANSGTDINAVLDFTYPVIRTRFADPLQWDFDTAYDVLTVVSDGNGNSYTSRQAVPAHTPLTDTDYWVMTGVYDASLQAIRDDVASVKNDYMRVYGTVADMQADTRILSGMICYTLGFHTVGDGGAACYEIGRSGTANGIDVISLDNGLYASLVIFDEMSAAAFGATSGADASPNINAALHSCTVVTLEAETYTCSATITVPTGKSVKGKGAAVTTLTFPQSIDALSIGGRDSHVSGLSLSSTSGNTATCIILPGSSYAHRITIEDVIISYFGKGIYCTSSVWDCRFSSMRINYTTTAIDFYSGFSTVFSDLYTHACPCAVNPGSATLTFIGCNFGITTTGLIKTGTNQNLLFINCNFECDSAITDSGLIITVNAYHKYQQCRFYSNLAASDAYFFGGGICKACEFENCSWLSYGGAYDESNFFAKGYPIGGNVTSSTYNIGVLKFTGSPLLPRPDYYAASEPNVIDYDGSGTIAMNTTTQATIDATIAHMTAGQTVYNKVTKQLGYYNGTGIIYIS